MGNVTSTLVFNQTFNSTEIFRPTYYPTNETIHFLFSAQTLETCAEHNLRFHRAFFGIISKDKKNYFQKNVSDSISISSYVEHRKKFDFYF